MTIPSTLHYSSQTRIFAGGLLACGWLQCAALRVPAPLGTSAFNDLLFVAAVLFVPLLLEILVAVALLRTVSGAAVGSGLLPGFGAGVFFAFVALPVLELVGGPSTGSFGVIDELWRSVGVVVLGGFAMASLYAPQAFLWRRYSKLRRTALLLLSAGPATLLVLPWPRFGSPLVVVLAVVLVLVMVWLAETGRTALEISGQMRAGMVVDGPIATTGAYQSGDSEDRLVGVALSGGGYRASLFALGALLYLNDACSRPGPPRRRIASVTSVSGGSVTNAAVGHAVSLGEVTAETMDEVAGKVVRHVVRDGSMFAGVSVLYYWLLLPMTGLGLTLLVWLAVERITWPLAGRAIAIPVVVVVAGFTGLAIMLRSDSVKSDGLETALITTGAMVGLTGIAGWIEVVMSRPEWRQSLSWLAALALTVAAIVGVWTLRGILVQRTFQRLLDLVTDRSRLADLRSRPHHVLCATEIQFDETAYLAADAIRSRSFRTAAPAGLPTARAIRASAALPGAFPPHVIRGLKGTMSTGTGARAGAEELTTGHMVLVDGGVRDNLGVDWYSRAPGLVDELLVISAAANRRRARAVTRIPGLSELRALLNLASIPYNTRERNRRRALSSLLAAGAKGGITSRGGALCHIEDSPFDLPANLLALQDKWGDALRLSEDKSTPDWELDQFSLMADLQRGAVADPTTLAARARAATVHLDEVERVLPEPPAINERDRRDIHLAFIRSGIRLSGGRTRGTDADQAWWKRTQLSASVDTTLGLIPARTAMNLLVHGYYLAMVNLHVLLGWPLLTDLGRERLDVIFAGTDASSVAGLSRSERLERERAAWQGRLLQAEYSGLVFAAIPVTVREDGAFNQRDVILAVGAGPERTFDALGLWLAPTPSGGGIAAILKARDNARAANTEFWREVITSLRDRGLVGVTVLSRDFRSAPKLQTMTFDSFDQVALEIFPDVPITAGPNSVATEAVPVLTVTLPDYQPIIDDVRGVVWAPAEDVGRSRLDRLAETWGEKYPEVVPMLSEGRIQLKNLGAVAERVRRLMLDADDRLDSFRKATRAALRERGAFPDEREALWFVQDRLVGGRGLKQSQKSRFPHGLR